jgi:hypothetical protein
MSRSWFGAQMRWNQRRGRAAYPVDNPETIGPAAHLGPMPAARRAAAVTGLSLAPQATSQ